MRSRRVALWLVLILVVGAITGAAVSFAGKAKPDFAWTLGSASIVGQWTTSGSVVLGTESALTAYSAATGAELWTWNIPFQDWLCAMSQSAPDGVGAVVYGLGPNQCTTLQTIDLASGTARWAPPLAIHSSQYLGSIEGDEGLSIGGSVVATADAAAVPGTGTSDTLASIDAATGTLSWADGSWTIGGCDLSYDFDTVVLDGTVYAVAGCYSGSVLSYEALLAIDAATGVPTDIGTLDPSACIDSSGYSVATISAFSGYLVVHCTGTLYALAAGSTTLTRLDTTGVDTGPAGLDDNGSNSPLVNLVSHGSTLYLVARSRAGHEDGIVAVDMADGKQLWTAMLGGATEVSLLSANSGAVVAEGADGAADSAALYSVGAADGRVTTTVGDLGGTATADFVGRTPAACLPAGGYAVCVFGFAEVGALKLPTASGKGS
ncbi:MAG TPA: PQQ-binding-like beta-propeller repeat protein [Actinocrinis sp.]|jgi:hypothetical protein